MATVALPNTTPTLLDVAKRTDPNGKIIPVVEALQQRNTFLQTMVWKEGNLDTGHRVAARNSLPSIAWVRLNEGVQPSKSTTDTYDENCGILEGLSSIDVRVAELNGNAAAFRASEDDAFLAQMANTLESAFFYESTALGNPERILGLSPRLSTAANKYGGQLLKSSGAGADNASIWLLGWGERSVYGISPRGQATGLTMEDMGKQRVYDTSSVSTTLGGILYKYETLFRWRCGLCVEDYRYVFRIANIPQSTLTANAVTGPALIDLMIQAYYGIYDPQAVRLAWYVNRRLAGWLHRQALNSSSNSTLSIDPAPMLGAPGVFGKPIVRCMGIPIFISDALTITEALAA